MIGAQTGLDGIEGPFAVAAVDLVVEDRDWAYGEDNRDEISSHFTAGKSQNPALFNGPMMVLDRWEIAGDTFFGRLCHSDFASFLHWRDTHAAGGLDDLAGARNLFGSAAVRSSEGHLLIGEMAPHTANAGRLYGPCGSLDLADVIKARIDIDGSMARELEEETGLSLGDARAEPGYLIWFDGPRVAVVREYRYKSNARTLAAMVRGFLAADTAPELSAIHFVSSLAALNSISDIEARRVPAYTKAMVGWFSGRT